MRGKRFKEEQIIGVLKEAEAGVGVQELCRKYGMSDGTFNSWVSPQLNYADIRLSKNGEVESAHLCEFKDKVGNSD